MKKALAIAVVAISLSGGATVALAQSSRDLSDVTGSEANRAKTQYGRYTPGARSYAYAPRLHRRWHWSHHRRWGFNPPHTGRLKPAPNRGPESHYWQKSQ